VAIQPALEKDEDLRPDIFVFRPVAIEQLFGKRFKEGQLVTLNSPD